MSKSQQTKISTYITAAIYITLALSIIAIIVGLGAAYQGESIEITVYLLAIGFISMALSGYILLQSRRRIASLKIETPPIRTTIECRKCGIKNVREFQRGDFVFKELDKCTKCEDKQIITAIYREVTEKEKGKPVNV